MGTDRAPTEVNTFARTLFADLPSRYDTLAYLLSFGQDRRWRAAVVEQITAADPRRVLDVACGPAGVTLAIAHACNAELVGVDLTEDMLRQGLRNVQAAGMDDRIKLAIARAEEMPFPDSTFDAISFSYLMRYVEDPAATIAELVRCLAPGGTIASLEFHVPGWAPARVVWWFYTRFVLPAAGGLTGGRAWYRVGRFLGPNISYHYLRYPVAAHVANWRAAGLENVKVKPMSFGGGLVMSATRERQSAAVVGNDVSRRA
jgi:demethylmenaquinone methyltransferase / 2-methoxy-6-polyprenyl-1,4-benzoquinol methylase